MFLEGQWLKPEKGIRIKNFNIVRIDSKGRIIIPFHIRDYLGLKEGTELIVSNNGRKELKIFPLLENTAQVEILLSDTPGSLAKILDVLTAHNADILMSTSKTIERGKMAEWVAILDISECKSVKSIESELNSLDVAKKVKMAEK